MSQPPAAGGLPNADEGYQLSLLGDLHLDQEDEPKRGASRANSVRFDESAIQGHWGQGARSSGDPFPPRAGSSLGNHPLMDRSSSTHKLDGRHSSAGQSIYSAHSTPSVRANSVGPETSFGLGPTVGSLFEASRNQPGMALLGPVPSIVRCWLTETFSHDTLIYAAICTASYESSLSRRLVHRLALGDQVEVGDRGKQTVNLLVYLAEASVLSSPRSGVPAMNVDFTIVELDGGSDGKQMEVFVGSDALRAHNADILFSQNVMTLIGEDQKKLSVPLVRPEDENIFKCLYSTSYPNDGSRTLPPTSSEAKPSRKPDSPGRTTSVQTTNGSRPNARVVTGRATQDDLATPLVLPDNMASVSDGYSGEGPGSARHSDVGVILKSLAPVGKGVDQSKPIRIPGESQGRTRDDARKDDVGEVLTGTSPTQRGSPGKVWGLWRREQGHKADGPSGNSTTGSGYQRPGRSRGVKVLRPSKSSISSNARSYSVSQDDHHPQQHQASNTIASMNSSNDGGSVGGSVAAHRSGKVRNTSQARRSVSGDFFAKPSPPVAVTNHRLSVSTNHVPHSGHHSSRSASTSNPIGGASAFSWLNGGGSGVGSSSSGVGGNGSGINSNGQPTDEASEKERRSKD